MSPFVSVIIPLYNKEKSIKSTIETVLKQTYEDYEIIVVNDGSKDKGVNRVTEIRDPRVRLINQENAGVSSARNTGIHAAKGEWILFLDADDVLLPNALSVLISNIKDNNTIVAADFLVQMPEYEYRYLNIPNSRLFNSEEEIYKAWALRKLFLRAGSFIMPTDVAKMELYNSNYSRFEDVDFIFRCFSCLKIYLVPEVVMIYVTTMAEGSKVNIHNWQNDYLFFLKFEPNKFWKNCVLGKHVDIAIKSYPTKSQNIKSLYKSHHKYILISRALHYYSIFRHGFWTRCNRKVNRLLNSEIQ